MPRRLTEAERRDRAATGAELQTLITDIAVVLGWQWAHFRACREAGVIRVPVAGTMGKGWPDLILAHWKWGMLGIEVKRQVGDDPTPAQQQVHEWLRAAGLPVYVLRPSDWREPLTSSRGFRILSGAGDG